MECLRRNLVRTNLSKKKTACFAVNGLLINYHLTIVNDSEPTTINVKNAFFLGQDKEAKKDLTRPDGESLIAFLVEESGC